MRTVHLIIKGRVQGVFFRATAKEVAADLEINGWVKNTINGDVEIMASGDDEKLEKFVQWCRRGPSKAKVDNMIVEESEQTVPKGFSVVR